MRAEIERLRRLVETQAETIKKLEGRSADNPPAACSSDAEGSPNPPVDRESLILSLVRWRMEHGVSDPQRYLRNRSTDQLWKMYRQIQQAGPVAPYRLGRSWKSAQNRRPSD